MARSVDIIIVTLKPKCVKMDYWTCKKMRDVLVKIEYQITFLGKLKSNY